MPIVDYATLPEFEMRPGIAAVLLPVLLPVLLLGGCAGPKVSYSDTVARIDASGTARVAVAAYDQRTLITSGREGPAFVGRQWSLYHMATVTTASGRPLADDLTSILVASLASKGFKVIPVVVSSSESPVAVAQKMALMQVDRGLVLTVADWRTDTRTDANNKTQLFYELDLKVLDSSGQILAQRRLAGQEEALTGSARDAFREKLERLMNDPEVAQGLSVSASPATAVEPVAPPSPPPPHPPAASTPPAATPARPDVAGQLRKLKELYEQGLITEDVYKEKMRQILNQL